MKDIVITAKRQKMELLMYICFLVIALGVNTYAIIKYKGPWVELFTQLPYTILIGTGFYIVFLFLRLIWSLVRSLLKKKVAE